MLAALAVALVAGLVALAGWWLSAAAPPPKAPHPFGMGLREAAPATSGVAALLLSWQSAFFNALRAMLTSIRDGGGGAWALLGIGFAYGVFHAAGPGHGKAIISAYIVSSERALARGIAVSVAAALVQAVVAIALVGIVFLLVGGTAATMSRTANAVEIAGFSLVAALGAYLVWKKAGALAILLRGEGAGRASAFDPTCSCGPVDPARTGRTLVQMAGVALGAGIRPCAGAIVVLTLARSYGIFPLGIAATLAMALGTALTTSAIAMVSVYAKRLALRYAGGRGETTARLGAGAELIAAAFVLVIGLALVAGLWDVGGGT
ncbi:nickel/cobalt transporter [Enterovirga rhinocerotis]|nr:nickel transporter [Enterovirga rhinocerotis]